MLYAILGHDSATGLSKRPAARAAHLAYLQELRDEGRLVLAGTRPKVDAVDPGAAGYHGSLVVAEFADLESARAWADDDPYAMAGVYERVEVSAFAKGS